VHPAALLAGSPEPEALHRELMTLGQLLQWWGEATDITPKEAEKEEGKMTGSPSEESVTTTQKWRAGAAGDTAPKTKGAVSSARGARWWMEAEVEAAVKAPERVEVLVRHLFGAHGTLSRLALVDPQPNVDAHIFQLVGLEEALVDQVGTSTPPHLLIHGCLRLHAASCKADRT
jgi:hypothetical protein